MKTLSLSARRVRVMIPLRPLEAHKGDNGHLLIVAGSRGMSGAAALTSWGALKGGAGLVTTAMPDSECHALITDIPEVLTLPLSSVDGHLSAGCLSSLNRYRKRRVLSALAIGPGLSASSTVRTVVRHLLVTWRLPTVLDADGINVLSGHELERHPALILTPHPGEMARFLGIGRERVMREGATLVARTAAQLGIVCVLKGHRTVISDGRTTYVNTTGNPAMATGGMGDVLTGLIGSFLAQGLAPLEAAAAGVYLHGLAGDLSRIADRGLLARELALAIPRALKRVGVGSRGRS